MSEATLFLNRIFRSTFNSYTMVFFSKNRWFGMILFVVSFFDLYAGIAGLLSILTANVIAWMLGLNRSAIVSGFYGFNALLVGLGLGMAFQPQPQFYLLLVFTALATLFITLAFEGVLGKYGLPYLTFPFLVSLWIATLAARSYSSLLQGESDIYTLNTIYERGGPIVVHIYNWFGEVDWPIAIKTYFKSLGAIFFQYHLFAGLLIALGLLIYSRIAFVLSVLGFASAWVFYLLIGADMNDLNYGYIGFNHILTAIAIGGFFMVASRWSFLWVILLTPIITIISGGFAPILQPLQLPLYSLPFNLMVVLFLYGMKFRERMLLKPETVLIQYFSPEKNLYIGQNSNRRFSGKTMVPLSLPFYGMWKVNQAHNGAHTHKEAWRHAWDFVIVDEQNKEYQDAGAELTDFYCYNMPVTAPADGWIEEVVNNIADNDIGEVNVAQNWGNTVIIRHSEGLYTKLSHLKSGSIKVAVGSWVVKGQVLAACGNSGRSPYPHLHFQAQSTPHIGSPTLDYPISQFISYGDGQQLKLYQIPVLNEGVGNVQKEQALVKAFHFLPGQSISLSCPEDTFLSGKWEVKVDMYKNQYLEDSTTKSKAFFHTDGSVFFFSHYEGTHQCALYYFYLMAYKVPLAFYQDLEVQDMFPPSSFSTSVVQFLQDFIAPFHIFLKPEYHLKYHELSEDMSGNRVILASECSMKLAGKKRFNYRFTLEVAGDKLQTMTISSKSLNARIDFIQS
jgi:urea transporter/murein DD-endopeptidase MepM/ murein hydrolase activator NlpD